MFPRLFLISWTAEQLLQTPKNMSISNTIETN